MCEAKHMDPALRQWIDVFGSQVALARVLEVRESTVSMWRLRGMPDRQKWRALQAARERNLQLDPEKLGLPLRAMPELGRV